MSRRAPHRPGAGCVADAVDRARHVVDGERRARRVAAVDRAQRRPPDADPTLAAGRRRGTRSRRRSRRVRGAASSVDSASTLASRERVDATASEVATSSARSIAAFWSLRVGYGRGAWPTRGRRPELAIFSPALVLLVELETDAEGQVEVHIHPGGQGYWVGRMAAVLGARPGAVRTRRRRSRNRGQRPARARQGHAAQRPDEGRQRHVHPRPARRRAQSRARDARAGARPSRARPALQQSRSAPRSKRVCAWSQGHRRARWCRPRPTNDSSPISSRRA